MKMILSLGWLFISTVHTAEPLISDKFTDCREYFYKGQLPEGFDGIALPHHFNPSDLPDGIKAEELTSPAYICQQYWNKFQFASLYDRGRRLPLYSAYILDKRSSSTSTNKREKHFRIEPQLIYRQLGGTMQHQDATKRKMEIYKRNQGILEAIEKNDPDCLIRTSQAVDADYRKSGYDRGHVNPRLHHVNADEQNATFTFTNVAPMTKKLNTNFWNQYENKMIGYADGCTAMYVVTGIVPGNNWIKGDRVNIPSYVWSAYCCVDNNDKPIKSGAGLRENDFSDNPVNEIEMNELQGELKHLLKVSGNIAIFYNNCA